MFEYFATNIFRLSFKPYRYCKFSQVISRVSQKYKKHNDKDFIKYLSNMILVLIELHIVLSQFSATQSTSKFWGKDTFLETTYDRSAISSLIYPYYQ